MQKITSKFHQYLTDAKDWSMRAITGKLHLPPLRLRDIGSGDFEAVGREFLNHFIERCDLKPSARILEIGCGIGRIALPLTDYLTNGNYVGMDVKRTWIDWCKRHISSKYSNFQFVYADLYNKRYNPKGQTQDKNYSFPYSDQSFDFIFLTSVFTHILPPGLSNYLHEIKRMLADNGQVFMTFFLLHERQNKLAVQGRNMIDFKYENGIYQMRDADIPESAIAYNAAYLLNLFTSCGFTIQQPILYGTR